MTPLARALNALERLNARAAHPAKGAKIGEKVPSRPLDATEGDAGSDGGYDATERAWWGVGPADTQQGTDAIEGRDARFVLDHKGHGGRVRAYGLAATVSMFCSDIEQLTNQIDRMTDKANHSEAEIERMAADLLAKDATIERLAADLASRTGDLDDAEARCERLWLQLQEAANVPDVSEIPWDLQTAWGTSGAVICSRCFWGLHDQCQGRVKTPGHAEEPCACCGKGSK